MSDLAARQRTTIDLDQFERHLNPTPAMGMDPLAELARLVGDDDPFKSVFAAPRQLTTRADLPQIAAKPFSWPGPTVEPPGQRSGLGLDRTQSAVEPSLAPPVMHASEPAAEEDWLGADEFAQKSGTYQPMAEAPARTPRRTLYVLGAVLVLLGGAVTAAVSMKGGTAVGQTKATPTILAATGPTKIQPDNPGGVDVPNQDSSILDKSKPDNIAGSKVVSSGEQPVDLSQTQNQSSGRALGTGTATPPPASSLFPEPKRVKTVVVRPDGSVVPNDTAAAQAAAQAAASRPAPVKPDPVAAAKPATPKATTRVATTPKADTPASPVDAAATAPAKPRVLAAARTPTETVDAAATSAKGGAYAVQLAAPTSEQEAKDTSSRLTKTYAGELGGLRPSIRKADVGDKSIYRVRVGNLSQDDAKALCTRLQASGGKCFVAKN